MPSEESSNPEVMRDRLKFRLRELREGAGFTQRQVADKLHMGLSKVVRIEQGAVSTSPFDARAMVELYGVTDPAIISEIQDLARRTKGSPWTRFNKIYSKPAITLFGSEQSAKLLRKYESELVPGLLQTKAYATALLQAFGFTGENLAQRIEARILRQKMLTEPDRPRLEFVIGEAVIIRKIGGDEVMLAQLEKIKELCGLDNFTLQVLPFAAGAHRRMGGGFTHLEFPGAVDDLLYRESSDREESTQQAPEVIAEYLEDFIELQAKACRPEESVQFIDDTISRLY